MIIYPNRIYRHFKGGLYLVIDVAIYEGTGDVCVVYRALYGDCQMYVRPMEEFLSPVDKKKYPEAKQERRFELYDPKTGGLNANRFQKGNT